MTASVERLVLQHVGSANFTLHVRSCLVQGRIHKRAAWEVHTKASWRHVRATGGQADSQPVTMCSSSSVSMLRSDSGSRAPKIIVLNDARKPTSRFRRLCKPPPPWTSLANRVLLPGGGPWLLMLETERETII